MKLAANLTLLYPGLPLAARMAAAREDGFAGVEILFPYDLPPEQLAAQLREHGLALALVNTPLGPAGEKGLACVPGREADFAAALDQALAVCRATGCRIVHAMAGMPPAPAGMDECRATLIGNLQRAAPRAAQAGVTLTLEPLNRADMPGYFYYLPEQAADIIRAVDHPNVGLQFDIYHNLREGLDPHAELRRVLPLVRHVQFAGPDGRHEPDPASPPVAATLRLLAQSGYGGWVGCEYTPRGLASAGLKAWRGAYDAACGSGDATCAS
ncbi:xylose isomerase-like TIM barrel domain protein [Bordetella bronchiseptica E014]|uniref:hydroxypyruvate isomerase family protein n=1 Tax=Bordetella bronchiseptica TaxID=518 RepID=UPI000459ACE6|nr:TIM barrel protein [Bordetella bronchiseptica]KCV56957.1 xylose isomerase-like TIM barrel domain protein [Bordetella bronchiseptica 7E71]KDC18124.1 xylose isomerase-like TIM barrel domain protein [Bordetella bronchiseptica E014]